MPQTARRLSTASKDESAMDIWWSANVRMYHPNMSERDLPDMDTERFVTEAAALGANSIVVSAGGLVAYYPTEIAGHRISTAMGDADFMDAVSRAARREGIRVIARVDFSGMRESLLADHPDWAAADVEDKPFRRFSGQDLIATCPNSPYRGEGFAFRVLDEIMERYQVDGFHVNAGHWPGHCRCGHCKTKFEARFGKELPRSEATDPELWALYIDWRQECTTASFAGLRERAEAHNPEAIVIAELFLHDDSYDVPSLALACSTSLFTTGDVLSPEATVRSWAGLAARFARTANRSVQPLVNIKIFVKPGSWWRTSVPPAEYRLWAWQALANGAGLKTPMHGTTDQDDVRNVESVRQVFTTIRDRADLLAGAKPVAPVALVWPQQTLNHWGGPPAVDHSRTPSETTVRYDLAGPPDSIALASFEGMFNALVENHVQFDVVSDRQLEDLPDDAYSAIVLAGTACLSDAAVARVKKHVDAGGSLVATGWAGWYSAHGGMRAELPFADIGGVKRVTTAALSAPGLYFALDGQGDSVPPELLQQFEGTRLLLAAGPGAAIAADGSATHHLPLVGHRMVWPVEGVDTPVPLDCDGLVLKAGKGRVATFGLPIDAIYRRLRLVDHANLLTAALRWSLSGTDPAKAWPIESEAPRSVEICLLEKGTDRIVHYVNFTGTEPLLEVTPVASGLSIVRLDRGLTCHSVSTAEGHAIPFTQNGSEVHFDAGVIHEQSCIVVSCR